MTLKLPLLQKNFSQIIVDRNKEIIDLEDVLEIKRKLIIGKRRSKKILL